MKTCFFIGHREPCPEIRADLTEAIRTLIIRSGVTEFVVGGYGGFDALAAEMVREQKKEFPEVRLIRLLPYYREKRGTNEGDDGTLYPPGMETVPKRFAIPRANRYMVEHADELIAYVWHPASNAMEILNYAKRRERRGLIRIHDLGKKRKQSPEGIASGLDREE